MIVLPAKEWLPDPSFPQPRMRRTERQRSSAKTVCKVREWHLAFWTARWQGPCFFSQPRNECVAENANDGPPRLSRSQGKGNRLTISRMIDDLPPASFEKCGDEHHSNRKEKTLLPAPGMTARGQLASLPPQVRAGSRKVRTDLPRRFATAASIDQILKSCFLLWSCRFRRVCVAFSFCCGACDFRLPAVSRFAVLVS